MTALSRTLLCAAATMTLVPALAAPLAEPTTFSSSGGTLDLLMVAQETALTGLTGATPKGWAYQVCKRPTSGNACPSGTATPYGGVRLALQPGDTLKIRLVNNLPLPDPNMPLDRTVDDPLLKLNPTNLHTHGLVVDGTPNTSVTLPPVYGDFIFTSVFNPANGDPAKVDPTTYNALHAHGDVVSGGVADYLIKIPSNHPQGAFWFHPHMHGISVNQISAGMAGIITVGSQQNYTCGDDNCNSRVPDTLARHIILKEMQVTAQGPQYQTDPAFCLPTPAAGIKRNGSCAADPATYPAGGNWFFTANGQQYPSIQQASADGEIWRLQNASANLTYDLTLVNNATQAPMVMQLLSLDGVTVKIPPNTVAGDVVKLGGNRFKYIACPTTVAANSASNLRSLLNGIGILGAAYSQPICVSELYMMPSSRAEVWVSYRDASNNLAAAPAGASATLRNNAFNAGPSGDTWPQVDIATVQFAAGGTRSFAANFLRVSGFAFDDYQSNGIFKAARNDLRTAPLPAGCAAIPAGYRRRVYFANMGTDIVGNAIFGLGYEVIDAKGVPVPGSLVPVQRFDAASEICLPLGTGNTPVTETWEIINLSAELHNFHIHQTKFKVVSGSAPVGSVLAASSQVGAGIEVDNIPLPYATVSATYPTGGSYQTNGACTVSEFKSGACQATPMVLSIPFSRVGKFVYHCHILEHEDGGMMQAIRVVTAAK